MSRSDTIGNHKTTVSTENGVTRVTYHATTVFEYDRNTNTVILRSGGWQTNTTKLRINQAIRQFAINELPGMELFAGISQHKGEWTVHWHKGEGVPFSDGMVLKI